MDNMKIQKEKMESKYIKQRSNTKTCAFYCEVDVWGKVDDYTIMVRT